MKFYLALFITLLQVFYSGSASAQARFRLAGISAPGNGFKTTLFSLQPLQADSLADSTSRVVHVYAEGERVVSYKVGFTRDSLGLHAAITDSVVHNVLVLQQLQSSDTLQYKSVLINTSDLNLEFPIEDLYVHTNVKSKAKAAAAGAMKSLVDSSQFSIPKKKPVTVHGSIRAIGQASDNQYSTQGIPQNYVRTYVNADVDLFGIPFSTGYNYTTESNSGANKINNFRFSFQYEQFHRNLKTRMEQRLQTDKQDKIKRVTKIDIGNLNKEFGKLQNELSAKDYKRLIDKNIKVLELGERDTSFKKSYRYKKAHKQNLDHQAKLDRLKEIEKLKTDYLKYSQVADYDTRMKELNLSRPKDFRRGAKRFGLIKPGQSIFLSVKKLDLGTFDPDYTTLVLSGVSLTGVNIEMNPGNLYGAFTWGKAVANFDNPLAFSSLAGGRTIMAGRLGVGQKEKLLVAMSLLKGTDDAGNMVKDSNYNYYLPNYNYVIGADVKYKINEQAEVGVEYAKSQNREIGKETRNTEEQIGNLVNPEQGKYSSAWYAYTKFNINDNRTRIKASTRIVDPFYYSFGTPYLRRDNFRIELKGEQLFWKNQITTGITYRRDRDNLYGLKQGTSVNNTYIFNAQIRIKKYPYLILTYSPNYQSFYNSALQKQIKSTVKLYNAVLGYTHQNKKVVANSTFSYTKQYNESNQAEWPAFDVSQYAFYENVMLRQINLTLSSGVTYALPKHQGDTGRVFTANVQCTKGLFKNKISVLGGYKYQKDFTLEERNIAEAGTSFSLGWGINCQITAEKHFIKSYTTLNPATQMMLGRITLIKTF
jgi:hypothetical protein